jgi:hypothetical protein
MQYLMIHKKEKASKGMFAPGVRSTLNMSISNELRCSFRLDSLC